MAGVVSLHARFVQAGGIDQGIAGAALDGDTLQDHNADPASRRQQEIIIQRQTMISRKAEGFGNRVQKNAFGRPFRFRIQQIDGGGDRSVQIAGHGGDVLQDAVLFHSKDVGGVNRAVEECRADDLGGHIVIIQDVQIVDLPALLGRDILEGSDRTQRLVVVRKQEVAVIAPVAAPAVLHDPDAVCGRTAVLRPAFRREAVVPADDGYSMVRAGLFEGILGIDDRVGADIGHIRFLAFKGGNVLIAPSESTGLQNHRQLIMVKGG